jgi:hypothetical protein
VTLTGEEIAAAARAHAGAPVAHRGRRKWLDCIGLVLAVAEDLGLRDSAGALILRRDYRSYPRQPRDGFLETECRLRLVPAFLEEPLLPGMIITLRAPLNHAAVVARFGSDATMIHAHPLGKIAEHRIDGVYRAKITGAFRFPGVEY